MVEWAQERKQWEQERKQWEQERQQWTHDGSVGSRAQAVDSRTHVFLFMCIMCIWRRGWTGWMGDDECFRFSLLLYGAYGFHRDYFLISVIYGLVFYRNYFDIFDLRSLWFKPLFCIFRLREAVTLYHLITILPIDNG